MADGDISLLAIYDKVASVDSKVGALTARVDEQLAHGQRKMDDHETRIRLLEQAKWRAAGAAGTVGALAGGAAGSLLSWMLTRHP